MTKNFLKSRYLKLCVAALSCVSPIESKQITPANIPVKKQTISPVQAQPITPPVQPQPKPILTPQGNGVQPTKNDPEILDINRSIKVINNQHDCNTANWKNQESACQCCLTYGKGRFGEEQTADQIIDHCTNKSKQCNTSSISSIKRKYNAQNMSSNDILNTLYSNTTVVHKMAINPALIKSNGNLTEDGLASILAQAYDEGKLKNKDFNAKQCLEVKSLGSGSGFSTLQLFKVTSTCMPSTAPLLYFVKESKKALTESIHLKAIEEYPGMKELISPNIVKGFPTIALPFFYFSYHPHHQNIHYIVTMPGAKGVVLCELITQFRDDQSTANANKLKKAYEILGTELSNFYKRFMTPVPGKKIGNTVVHGDFHCNNMFYDETEHFTFIDVETMVRSFKKPKSPKIDFMRLIFPPFSTTTTMYNFKELITGIKSKTYFNLTLKPFVRGYISTYNAHDQKQVLQELKAMFTNNINVSFLDFDRNYMQTLINQDITPIFNEIAKTLS